MVFEKMLEDLPEAPTFRTFRLRDVNPLSGHVKRRLISDPNEGMRVLHRRMIEYLRSRDSAKLRAVLKFATGSRSGNSPLRNVLPHRRHRFFYLIDLKDAFPSVNGERLAQVLVELDPNLAGQENEVFVFLRAWFLSPQGGIVVGASASPDLFNIYAGSLLDQRLGEICARHGTTYTRYVDDLTFSSADPITKGMRREIREVLTAAGFNVNHAKAQVRDALKGPVFVNGIGLELGGRLFCPRSYLRTIRGAMHLAATKGSVEPAVIHGMMGAFFAITPREARKNETERDLVQAYERFRSQLAHSR